MNLAANSSKWAWLAPFAILIASAAPAQEATLDVQLDGPMTREMRLALAQVLDPQYNHAALLSAFEQSVASAVLIEEGTIPEGLLAQDGTLVRPLTVDIEQTVTATALNVQQGAPGTQRFLFSTPSPEGEESSEVADPAFIVTDQNSNLFRAYAGFTRWPSLAQSAGTSLDTMFGIAAPISQQQIAEIDLSRTPVGDRAFSPVVINVGAVEALARLDRDVEVLGLTARNFTLPDGVMPTSASLAALQAAWSSSGLSPPTVIRNDASEPEPIVGVEIDNFATEVIQTAIGGTCEGAEAHWPFDAAEVAKVINDNVKVFTSVGVLHFDRSEVMIVDSGLPIELAENGKFSRYLHVNIPSRLAPGKYFRNTSLESTEACTRRDREPSRHRHGYVTRAGSLGKCLDFNALAQIAPPRPNQASDSYVWDHGGFVGVLAAGGPELIEIEGIDRFVGVSFARVMRNENNILKSDGGDVSEAIQFAMSRNVPIINMSLRVSELHEQIITPKLSEYWRQTDGLTIAAAGNTGGLLTTESSSFPASAGEEPRDNLIIVGGIMPGPPGEAPKIWTDSSRSNTIVDIAAPATAIRSLNGSGEQACYLGTSVAAPQVSFTAAVLRSMGFQHASEIKRRILATADIYEDLSNDIRHGRVLDIARALDVFSDLVWLRGENSPRRGEILGNPRARSRPFFKLCTEGAESQGWIDLARLHAFERLTNGQARIWSDKNIASEISDLNGTCTINDLAEITLRTSEGELHLQLSEIDRIVPSRFRMAFMHEGEAQ